MTDRFSGKTAIVTGAASGIGAAITALLAAEGARVLAVDINETGSEGNVIGYVCDISDAAQVKAMVAAAVQRLGRIDLLFNNAGIGCLLETTDMDDATWEKVFAINVHAILYACRAVIPVMRAQGGGAIVNTASISGLVADYGFTAYNASKGAVVNYTRSLAIDNARHNIRVNALCPGFIAETGMTGAVGFTPIGPAWESTIPMGRGGTAAEMAKAAAFLASDDASYITGANLVADGGITAHTGQPNIPALLREMAGS